MRSLLRSVFTVLSALAAAATLVLPAAADNLATIAIAPATGVVTLTPRWAIGSGLAGFHLMTQDLSLGGGANQFYSLIGAPIPAGGNILAFYHYIAASGAATPSNDIGSKLTPNSYSALTLASPDVGYGAINFYTIHHAAGADYFTAIIPGSGTSSAVTDLKPMSGPGGPSTLGASGYFSLTFAGADLGYGANYFYYLRTDPVTGFTRFGILNPAQLGTSADEFDLGMSGYTMMTYSGTDVGFGANLMYYLRLDPVTGFTILGTLNPISGATADVANLGSVYSNVDFVVGDVGFGANNFYATGPINATGQTVSFAAQINRAISAGSFAVSPSASSGLPVTLTVVPGSVGAASISGPVAGIFTVTPTAPGLISLQATQAGQTTLPAYEFNMLRQSFTITGLSVLAFSAQPTSQTAAVGSTATFSAVGTGTTAVTYQWQKAGVNIPSSNASATTATLVLPSVSTSDAASYQAVITDQSGSLTSTPVLLVVTAAVPVISNSALEAAGTIGASFSYSIAATGTPTSYTASPLPVGLSIAPGTGVITGTPTVSGVTSVILGATNASGTGNATLFITIAPAAVAPVITNQRLTVGATVGTPLSYAIFASGFPTSYSAAPLPPGLTFSSASGTAVISGTPTSVGITPILLSATNAIGTGNATLTISVAAAGVTPIIVNNPLTAAGTVGTPFGYTIAASGSPTTFSATPLPAGLSLVSTTGAITGTPTAAGITSVLLGATNAFGTGNATLLITVAAAGAAPIITNSPLTAAGTVGIPFSFSTTASGLPSSYSAAPLPPGLVFTALTGVISGTPSAVGITTVLLGATNANGTGVATLTIGIAAAGAAPIIVNSPLTAPGTVGSAFSFAIAASGVPTSYGATPLPAGLSIVGATGVITGTPTATGVTSVLLSATNAVGTGNATLLITVASAGTAPVFANGPLTAAGTIGIPFSYVITATGSPTSYTLVSAPPGLSIVGNSGDITGTPTTAGTSIVAITATNAFGSSTETLTIVVAGAGTAPVIANSAAVGAGTLGVPFSYTIAASGLPTTYSAAPLPPGLSIVAATGVITGTPTTTGTTVVVLTAQNALGISTGSLTITVGAGTSPPTITSPAPTAGVAGSPFPPYLIVSTGLPTSYSATGLPAGLTLNVLTGAITGIASTAGSYPVVLSATNSAGTTSVSFLISVLPSAVVAPAPYSRIVNFSLRALSGPGTQSLVMGFIVQGTGKDLLVRGIGPTLASFGITGFLAAPVLTLYSGNTAIGTNGGWGTNANGVSQAAVISSTELQVGAFALPSGSLDSALLTTLNQGAYTAIILGQNSTTGVALAEVYDTDTSIGPKLINTSARMAVGPGNNALVAGFVIEGNTPKTVLIRGVGPTLAAFGVSGFLPNPQIAVFQNGISLATNVGWGTGTTTSAQLSAAAAQVGAFALPVGSADSALLITLPPGVYSVQLSGGSARTGIALIEIYDVM